MKKPKGKDSVVDPNYEKKVMETLVKQQMGEFETNKQIEMRLHQAGKELTPNDFEFLDEITLKKIHKPGPIRGVKIAGDYTSFKKSISLPKLDILSKQVSKEVGE